MITPPSGLAWGGGDRGQAEAWWWWWCWWWLVGSPTGERMSPSMAAMIRILRASDGIVYPYFPSRVFELTCLLQWVSVLLL